MFELTSSDFAGVRGVFVRNDDIVSSLGCVPLRIFTSLDFGFADTRSVYAVEPSYGHGPGWSPCCTCALTCVCVHVCACVCMGLSARHRCTVCVSLFTAFCVHHLFHCFFCPPFLSLSLSLPLSLSPSSLSHAWETYASSGLRGSPTSSNVFWPVTIMSWRLRTVNSARCMCIGWMWLVSMFTNTHSSLDPAIGNSVRSSQPRLLTLNVLPPHASASIS